MATPPTTASTWYAGFGGSTAVRRAQAHAKTGLPVHGRLGQTIVALHGELDIASAPALRIHLLGTLQHSARLLILDLGEVPFCDAAGLAVLIGTGRRATGLGITLRLANPRPQVAELLHTTGLDRSFPLHPTAAHPRPRRTPPTESPPHSPGLLPASLPALQRPRWRQPGRPTPNLHSPRRQARER
ncbi:STAS domain-containing protein [Spirillospora sp. CA-253888]